MTALMPVQKRMLDASRGKLGFAFFAEMGLGKTLTALTEFYHLSRESKVTRMVVVAPNSFKSGWAREIEKHGFDFEFHVYRASHQAAAEVFVARGEKDADGNPPKHPFQAPAILIVNYDIFWKPKFQQLLSRFVRRRNVMLVCDESIMLKSPQARRTKGIISAMRAGAFAMVRILSGRPTTQGPHDLWAQLLILGAHSMNFYQFRGLFCRLGGFENRQVIGAQNTDRLQWLMKDCCITLRKQDWLRDLPDKSYTTREYKLQGLAALEYRRMEIEFLSYIRDKAGSVTDTVEAQIVIAKYTKLLQLQCGFVHDHTGEAHWLVEDGDNARLQELLELMDEEIVGKVCICYRHRMVGDKLHSVFVARGACPAQIKGGLKPDEIQGIVDTFNTDPRCRVVLLQLDAAKYGLTLLGDQSRGEDACRTMVFFENSYSLDTRTQIEDRIHRIGQRNAALYVDLVGSSMDLRVVAALQKKQGLFEAVFGK